MQRCANFNQTSVHLNPSLLPSLPSPHLSTMVHPQLKMFWSYAITFEMRVLYIKMYRSILCSYPFSFEKSFLLEYTSCVWYHPCTVCVCSLQAVRARQSRQLQSWPGSSASRHCVRLALVSARPGWPQLRASTALSPWTSLENIWVIHPSVCPASPGTLSPHGCIFFQMRGREKNLGAKANLMKN